MSDAKERLPNDIIPKHLLNAKLILDVALRHLEHTRVNERFIGTDLAETKISQFAVPFRHSDLRMNSGETTTGHIRTLLRRHTGADRIELASDLSKLVPYRSMSLEEITYSDISVEKGTGPYAEQTVVVLTVTIKVKVAQEAFNRKMSWFLLPKKTIEHYLYAINEHYASEGNDSAGLTALIEMFKQRDKFLDHLTKDSRYLGLMGVPGEARTCDELKLSENVTYVGQNESAYYFQVKTVVQPWWIMSSFVAHYEPKNSARKVIGVPIAFVVNIVDIRHMEGLVTVSISFDRPKE